MFSSSSFDGNVYLTKYSPSGSVLWARNATNSTNNLATAIGLAVATDINANVFVAGVYHNSPITFGNFILAEGSDTAFRIFLVKYDSLGNVLWATTPNGGTESYAMGLAADREGNIYLTGGYFTNSIQFGTITLMQSIGEAEEMYLAKYDAAGNALWARGSGTGVGEKSNANGSAVALDLQGHVYVTGSFNADSITFANFALEGSVGTPHGFLVKYDSSGNVAWAKNEGALVNSDGVASYGSEAVYVTGSDASYINNGNFFLTKYDTAGSVIWTKNASGCTDSPGYSVVTDINGNIYVTGGMQCDQITIDNTTLTLPSGGTDPMFVFIFDSSGHIYCSDLLPSGGYNNNSIALGRSGVIYIGGDFRDTTFTLGNLNVNSNNENVTGFMAAFLCPNCAEVAGNLVYTLLSDVFCPGDSTRISFSGDSGVIVSPVNSVSWIDSANAWLHPDTITTYTIGGYTQCGVYETTQFTITVGIFTTDIDADKTSFCPGDSTQICAQSGNYNYLWNTGETTSCIYTQAEGAYDVTVIMNDNCTAISNQILISVYPSPSVSISISGDTLRGFGAASYQWLYNDIPIAGANSSIYIVFDPGSYSLQIVDSNGCTATSTPQFVSGINGSIADNYVSIYPNPSKGNWILTVDNVLLGAEAEVLDAAGRLVFKTEIRNLKSEIAFNAASGVYLLSIKGENYSVIRKLVKS